MDNLSFLLSFFRSFFVSFFSFRSEERIGGGGRDRGGFGFDRNSFSPCLLTSCGNFFGGRGKIVVGKNFGKVPFQGIVVYSFIERICIVFIMRCRLFRLDWKDETSETLEFFMSRSFPSTRWVSFLIISHL